MFRRIRAAANVPPFEHVRVAPGGKNFIFLAQHYRKSHNQTTTAAYHTAGSTKEKGFGGEKITCSDCLSPDGEPAAKDLSCLSAEKRGDNSKILTHSLR